jgi:hypothetical protein
MNCAVIQSLAQRLRAADLANSQEQRDIFEKIREIRCAFDGPLDPESQRSLEAASMLVAYLARMGTMAGEDVRTIAARLLDTAYQLESGASALLAEAQRAGAPVPAAPIPAVPPPPVAPAPVAPRMHVIRSAKEPTQLGLQGQGMPAGENQHSSAERTATDTLGDMMLGQILLRRGQIPEEHIYQAAKVQRTTGLRIGDIFVKIGAATRAQVADALSYQAACRRTRESLPPEPTAVSKPEPRGTGLKLMGEALLGEILVERGTITRRQLERALEAQKATGMRIGEALVKLGATTQEHIEHALKVQSGDRRFSAKPGPGAGPGDTRR